VVSDGRYEPQNFPFFHIDDSALVWDFSTNLSNYTTLRAQDEAALGGAGWEIESSLTLNQQIITSVILGGGQYFGSYGPGSGGSAFAGVPSTPSDAALDYLPVGAADAGADAGPYQSAEDVRTADIAALFMGISGSNVRVTRMRSDITHAAMTKDFALQASADQSELSNVRNVTKSINLVCPTYDNYCGGSSGSVTAPMPGFTHGTGNAASSSSAGGGGTGGCVASAQSTGGAAASFGAVAGLLGLALLRRRSLRRKG
jgi:hypothetical protein